MAPGKLPPPRATQSHSWQGLKGCSFDTGHHRHPRSMSCIWLGKSLTGSEAWKELVKEASVESATRAVHTQFTLTVFEGEPHDANWARAGRRDERDIPTYVKESNLHLNRRALRPRPHSIKCSSNRNTFLLVGNMQANTRRNNYKLTIVTYGRGVRMEQG